MRARHRRLAPEPRAGGAGRAPASLYRPALSFKEIAMMCRHFLLRRKFVPYLEDALPAESVRRVEQHLVDCELCRDLFVRLRAGHQMAQRLERLLPARDERPQFAA